MKQSVGRIMENDFWPKVWNAWSQKTHWNKSFNGKENKKGVDLPPSLSPIILFRAFMYSEAIVNITPAVFQTGGSE